jgi:hypothetical protein
MTMKLSGALSIWGLESINTNDGTEEIRAKG